MTWVDWWRLAALVLWPLAAGWITGLVIHWWLDLRTLRALTRAHPAGIPPDAVPWHLRQHVQPAPEVPSRHRPETTGPPVYTLLP